MPVTRFQQKRLLRTRGQRCVDPSCVAFHLFTLRRGNVASPSRKIPLHRSHNMYIDLVDQIVLLIFDSVKRMTVLTNLGLRPSEKSRVVKPDDLRSAFRGIKKSAIERDRLLHAGTAPQCGCIGFRQIKPDLSVAQASKCLTRGNLISWGYLSS